MSSPTTTTDTQSSASVVEFAPDRDVPLIVNIISILRTIYIFLIKENPFVWWFLQGTRNPRADVEGPFYVIGAPNRNIGVGKGVLASITDLKQFAPFLFKLIVQDPKGEPISNASVDVWQATSAGEYFLRTYRLRGQFKTGSKGEVEILSVPPGKYGPANLQRAGHFHIIIKDPKGRFEDLTTQVYVCQGNQSTEMASDFVNFTRAQRHVNMLVCWSIPSATGGKALMEFPELPSDDVETQESVKWWNERLAERDQSLQVSAGGETVIRMNALPTWFGVF